MSYLLKTIAACLTILIIAAVLPPYLNQLLQQEPLYVSIIWHYHQPWYYSTSEEHFILPWVRLHSVGNYYKMGYILSKYPEVRATFTFSGSLIEQLIDYVDRGLMDLRQSISWRIASGESLNAVEIYSILKIPGGFFDINWGRIVERIPRYRTLRDQAQSVFNLCSSLPLTEEEFIKCIADQFTGGNYSATKIVDLAVLFNLFWIDPLIAKYEYPEVYQLMQRAANATLPGFTRDDLKLVLNAHIDIMSKVIPLYRELSLRNQVELIPVPYSHPLAPIITDFGWLDDFNTHVSKSIKLFQELFNYTPIGMWPAEQAINEEALEIMANNGISWIALDQSILGKAGIDHLSVENYGTPWYIEIGGRKIYLFYRNTELSNLISFEYSKLSSEEAVEDLVNRLIQIRQKSSGVRIVVIALDGENPWEYYEEFGSKFLSLLYQRLSELQGLGVLRTITPREFIYSYGYIAKEMPLGSHYYLDLSKLDIADLPYDSYGDAYNLLPRRLVSARVPEGSWASGELTVWIGDRQENAAWMWLKKAREEVLSALNASSMSEASMRNPQVVEYLLRAEASDWFWWYGYDGGGSPETFDPLFKAYLVKAYELAGLNPPDYLRAGFYPDCRPKGVLNSVVPKPIESKPRVDGVLEDLWINAVKSGAALNISIGPQVIQSVYVALDSESAYFAVIPWAADSLSNASISIYFTTPRRSLSPYNPGYNVKPTAYTKDLGIGLFFEVLVDLKAGFAVINAADGAGGWIQLYRVPIGLGEVVELAMPWSYIGLLPGDVTYLAIAVYVNQSLAESSTRVGLVHQLQLPRAVAIAPEAKVVFEMIDPIGDDDGAGGYKYPTAAVFTPGVFDLKSFKVIDAGDKVIFESAVVNLGGNPWGGPNGWSMQYIHVYIHTALNELGRNNTFGLNINIAEEHSWHMAILIAPGWGTDPVPIGERTALYYSNGSVIPQNGDLRVYADQSLGLIVVEASKGVLVNVEDIDKWIYVVALTSYDGYGSDRIRSFSTSPDVWIVGAPDYSLAIAANVIPRVMDLLAPTAEEQYSMLKSFNVTFIDAQLVGKPAVVKGYGRAAPQPTVTTIVTTVALTTTLTEATAATSTLTIRELTIAASTTTLTETITEIAPQELNIPLSTALVFTGLLVGIAATYLFMRRRSIKK